ncbi:NACHT domain-containing protein [Rhodococcus sp. C26F]
MFELGDNELGQVHKSVVRALDTDPALKRYYVALPYDRPAGDISGRKSGRSGTKPRKSAFTKWTQKKTEWEELAAARGMEVDFIYVGAHDLVSELTKPRHAGRMRYWFDASVLSPDGLNQRLADVVAKAGRRYSPQVHVEVEAVQVLEGLGRTERYVRKVQVALAGIRKARSDRWHAPKGDEAAFQDSIDHCIETLTNAEAALQGFLGAVRTTGPLPDIVNELRPVEDKLDAVHRLLRDRHLTGGGHYVDQAGFLYGTVQKAREALWEALSLSESPDTEAARVGRLLMTGRAGVGKTHLFCDVATRRIAAGLPTLVALGQDFDANKLLPQIGELVQIDGNLDEVLKVLDAAGEASGNLAMLMIDAVNEGTHAERWVDDLRVLSGAAERYPNVVLAVSCRTEFVKPVVGDADGFPTVEHYGFAEATSEAIDRYTHEYNLEPLTFPVLNPEYGNPLFLKLACEALTTLGGTHFTFGAAGLATVCNAFMEAVNKRLAAPTRCDYDETTNPVQAVVRALVTLGPGPYERAEALRITEELLPNRPWSKSLFLGLLREGVLMDTHDNHVAFSYQRLGDVLRALLLAEKTEAELSAWHASLGDKRWEERGTIGALAVIAPETLSIEIIDLFADEKRRVEHDVVDAFVESLALRAPQHTTDRTARIVEQLVESDTWASEVWEKLVRVACVPGHKVNAEWTHELLSSKPLPERDSTWSEWLIESNDYWGEQPVKVLLDWGWNPSKTVRETSDLPADVARLTTLILGWMLPTPDRRVRDRATKALVGVGERGPIGFAAAIRQFRGCNDPYIVERLAAAVCAVALRSSDPAVVLQAADAAVELVADEWPVHLLTRDYLRRTSAIARTNGWTGPKWLPPYGAKWPVRARSAKTIEAMIEETDYGYSSIWGSLNGMFGDFGRYILEPALKHFDHPDHRKLRARAERIIFSRVLELGWTPERFKHLESGRRRGRRDGPVERYGKKYQWIGLYEVLGRLADNHHLRDRWSDATEPFEYEYAEQLVYRDIDPTVLTPGGIEAPHDETSPWFMPVSAAFPVEVDNDYPRDLQGVPDPLDLIALTSPDGTKWLSLIRHGNWTQVHPPEIAVLNVPNLNIWMQIRGYLVPVDTTDALRTWATGKDWDGRWMPENAEVHSRLLGAHPESPDWDWADGNAESDSFNSEKPPTDLYQPIAFYGGTGTSRESAGIEEPTGYVPSRMLFNTLGLHRGKDFQWADTTGLAVFDPTAGMNEASTLVMRRDLTDLLAGAGYNLFWTVLLNKQRHDHDYGRPGPNYRWLSASASYLMTGETIECVSADAWRCSPYGEGDPEPVEWQIRRTG